MKKVRELPALFLVSCIMPLFGLSIQRNVNIDGIQCDVVTWTDSRGGERSAALVVGQSTCGGEYSASHGGYLHRFTWHDGSTVRICNPATTDALGGFGIGIHHGPWGCTEPWINSRKSGSGAQTRFVVEGEHHAIWEHASNISFGCCGQSPFIRQTNWYIFRDGEDQWQHARTSDVRHVPIADFPSGSDTRSPYNPIRWWSADDFPRFPFGYGTTHRGTANPPSSYDFTAPYNLCPYLESWSTTHDAEIGLVQTRLQTRHRAGRNRGVGTSGSNFVADMFEFQFADYQDWYGGRTAWQAAPANGENQIGITPGAENFSLTCVIGRRSNGTVERLISESNTAQHAQTQLTAHGGTVVTEGLEAAGLGTTIVFDKPGFDQLRRAWVLRADNNKADATLSLGGGGSIQNPTFILSGYTASSAPSTVTINGSPTDHYSSVDGENLELWVTLRATLSGASRVVIQGPADNTGITFSSLSVSPDKVALGSQQSVTFAVAATGASTVTLDLTPLGGGATAAMNGSGSTFSLAYSLPGSVPEGAHRIAATAANGSGGRKRAYITLHVRRPDLIFYNDDNSAGVGWTNNGTLSEQTGGAFEGTKHYAFVHNGLGSLTRMTFNGKDVRGYQYITFAARSSVAGQGFAVQMRSGNMGSDGAARLFTTDYARYAISMAEFLVSPGVTYNNADVTEIQFTVTGSGGNGTIYIDDIRATSYPEDFEELPVVQRVTSLPHVTRTPSVSVLKTAPGAKLILHVNMPGRVSVYSSTGRHILSRDISNLSGADAVLPLTSRGYYMVNFSTAAGERRIRIAVP